MHHFSDIPFWAVPLWCLGFCGAFIDRLGTLFILLGTFPVVRPPRWYWRLLGLPLFVAAFIVLLPVGFVLKFVGSFLRVPIGTLLTHRSQKHVMPDDDGLMVSDYRHSPLRKLKWFEVERAELVVRTVPNKLVLWVKDQEPLVVEGLAGNERKTVIAALEGHGISFLESKHVSGLPRRA